MKTNPLATIGITPESIAYLSTSAAMNRVKVVYRALMAENHPDKGGDPAFAVALNDAFSTLSKDPETFEEHRKAYIQRRPIDAELASLSNEMSRLKKNTARVFESLEGYVRSAARHGERVTAFNCGPCRLVLDDAFNRVDYAAAYPASDGIPSPEETRAVDERHIRTLVIDERGGIEIREGGRKRAFGSSLSLVGTIHGLSSEAIRNLTEVSNRQKITSSTPTLTPCNPLERSFIVPPATFARRLLPYLRAELTPNTFLVTCHHPASDILHYRIEGQIDSIHARP